VVASLENVYSMKLNQQINKEYYTGIYNLSYQNLLSPTNEKTEEPCIRKLKLSRATSLTQRESLLCPAVSTAIIETLKDNIHPKHDNRNYN